LIDLLIELQLCQSYKEVDVKIMQTAMQLRSPFNGHIKTRRATADIQQYGDCNIGR